MFLLDHLNRASAPIPGAWAGHAAENSGDFDVFAHPCLQQGDKFFVHEPVGVLDVKTPDYATGYSIGKALAQDFRMALLHHKHPVGPEEMVLIDANPGLLRRAGAADFNARKALEDLLGRATAPLVAAANEEETKRLGHFIHLPELERSASSLRRVVTMTARMSSRFSSALVSNWRSSSTIRCS